MRLPNGTLQMEMPFKNETPPDLDFTLSMASRRFILLERRFLKNNEFKPDDCAFSEEFVDLGNRKKVLKYEFVKSSCQVA